VVVADGGQARIFHARRANASAALDEIAKLERDSAHLPGRALVTDRTGRVFDSGSRVGHGPKSHARHGAQSDYDPHAVEVDRFAKRLARRLDDVRLRSGMDELTLIVEPRFLGVLRPMLSDATRKLVKSEIARDMVHANERQIQRKVFAA
jgi:protein required for attachment to host cells